MTLFNPVLTVTDFGGGFVKSLQDTASRRFSVAFHGLGNGRRLCCYRCRLTENRLSSTYSATRSSDVPTETSALRENRRRRRPPQNP